MNKIRMSTMGRSWAVAMGSLGIWGLVLAGLLGVSSMASCKLNEYCIDCPLDPDAINADGQTDGTDGDAPDVCLTTGAEQCDGEDNDCDGTVDEEAAQVGTACSNNVGECQPGTLICENGALKCTGGVNPMPELCDLLDNDCDGEVDEGNPGGNVACGTDVGECVAGLTACVNGTIDCVGDIGTVGGTPEACDSKDNDCDGLVDENLNNFGSCGQTDEGACQLGNLTCIGGSPVCNGAINPTFELCDAIDQDCDGNPTNGYSLTTDPLNCGGCGQVCVVPNAVAGCAPAVTPPHNGTCRVAGCLPNFYDIDGLPGNGCEYACTYQGPNESCNNLDDDCDGTVDENLTPPPICETNGACSGAVPACTPTGWKCTYGPDVSKDGSGDIIPETTCDGIDNDCDGAIDESHPLVGQACNDGGFGVCTGYGTYSCGPTGTSPLDCDVTIPGGSPSAEQCDGLDNDCDNMTDEGAATGTLPGQDWVSIGNGVSMMKYEASRPDARANLAGISDHATCSRPGVLPWTNVTRPQAQAACAAVGARLCSEVEWHRACSVVAGQTYPVVQPGNGEVVLEAEHYYQSIAVVDPDDSQQRRFVPDSAVGYAGLMALRASPNLGQANSNTQALSQSPYVDYRISMTQTGTHYVWVRMLSPSGSDDQVWVALKSGATPTFISTDLKNLTTSANNAWVWQRTAAISITGAGVHTLRIYMREDGVKIDQIVLTTNSSVTFPAPTGSCNVADGCPTGNAYAYASSPNTFNGQTCNGDAYDTDPIAGGDQDGILPTATLGQCYAAWSDGGIFDLSGNVREWTAPRLTGVNPIRGGSSSNIGEGTSCALNFTSAGDAFSFGNVGFRCCK